MLPWTISQSIDHWRMCLNATIFARLRCMKNNPIAATSKPKIFGSIDNVVMDVVVETCYLVRWCNTLFRVTRTHQLKVTSLSRSGNVQTKQMTFWWPKPNDGCIWVQWWGRGIPHKPRGHPLRRCSNNPITSQVPSLSGIYCCPSPNGKTGQPCPDHCGLAVVSKTLHYDICRHLV